MLKERVKHVALILLAVSLIGIGFMNYDYGDTIEVASIENISEENRDESNLGDVALVNSNVVDEKLVPNDEQTKLTNSSNDSDEYFSSTRLERETMYSEMLETYQKIVNSKEITNEQKAIAISEIDKITKIKNGIMIAENLIKNKNFEDVVILESNGTASVIVKTGQLTEEQVSQLQNIVTRELEIGAENINISKK